MFEPIFKNRREAGWLLAQRLKKIAGGHDTVVLGLPRGGIPVAFEIARELKSPLHAFVVRKLGTPGQEELAMGAVASGGVRVLNDEVVRALGISNSVIEKVTADEMQELKRREILYGEDSYGPDVRNKTVILIDDGLATGASMRAAIAAVRELEPSRVIVAVPVGAAETCEKFASQADEVVCLQTPEPFYSVGGWYDNFSQTDDAEVCELLRVARQSQRREAEQSVRV